ncbi:hypothetical protein HanRHA438_Chr05g0243251 [Helianthus annuus]|nr:hypothetical protein HanHA300_Chr05g0191561 [Helianthus annuus]KAJ0920607.1 hypothetical protein HanRHA438_Chr05g0243251 [Helianthus annuus]
MSVVCEPHLQASAREDVAQMSAVCKEKRVCFFPSKTTSHTQHTQALSLCSLSLYKLSLSTTTTTIAPPLPPPPHHLRHHTTASLSLYGLSLSHRTLSLYNHHHHRTTSATTTAPPPPSHRSLSLSLSQVSLSLRKGYGIGIGVRGRYGNEERQNSKFQDTGTAIKNIKK